MSNIWIICGVLLIGTAVGSHVSTIPTINTTDFLKIPSSTESTFKLRRSLDSFDHFDFTPRSRLLVPSSSSFSPRISIVDSPSNNAYKYLDASFTNNFPIQHEGPKLSSISTHSPKFDNSFHSSGASNFPPTLSPMNIRHLVTLGTIEAGDSHSIYPNKFNNGKFTRLNTRPLASNIGSSLTRSPINYSPTYPDIKSIKHNPTFVPASLTNTGNFVPINLEQLQTNREIPERIRTSDIELKPTYPATFNKPNMYLPSIDNYQAVPIHLPAAPYSFPNVGAANNYQLFAAQPQLHFPVNSQQPSYHSQPFERIRTDVEVINKKQPSVPTPKDDDHNDDDDDLGFNESDDGENLNIKQHDAGSVHKTANYDFPNSPLFDSYDAAFGKYSKLSPGIPKNEKLVEKPERYNPNLDEESEKKAHELQSDDPSSQASHENYEYRTENENGPRERLQRDYNDDFKYNDEFANFGNYGKDFNEDFEKSYHRKVPIEEFAHIKEVPDIDESVNNEKIVNHEEKKRGSRHTSITSPTKNEFGYKIPNQNRKKNESTEQTTQALSNNKRRKPEKNSNKTPKQLSTPILNTRTSFNAPINEIKSLAHRKSNPYIHRGGIKIINPPILPTSPSF
ncbi:hypothetical protein PV327_006834 [Microctonus hyperodae]|uniref:Uncharacterized protein n=1 Tax=Microctonus hyperodae TaxID=165561 RepID=A0AA39F595_MICHY|nr:hypothetical protein PV327_006834 [Microctonus hyperodae]